MLISILSLERLIFLTIKELSLDIKAKYLSIKPKKFFSLSKKYLGLFKLLSTLDNPSPTSFLIF